MSFYKKALRIINFQPCNSYSSAQFKKCFILKLLEKVKLENTLFVSKSINNNLPSLFSDWFLFSSDQLNETSWSSLGNLHKPSYKTNMARVLLLKVQLVLGITHKSCWEFLSEKFSLKKVLSDVFFAKCWCEISTFRYFKLMLDDFSNFASSISVLTFSLCFYFIIYILLSGLPSLSIQLIVAWNSPYSV